jgi:hypothetical protein
MTAGAKVWDGAAWVPAVGSAGSWIDAQLSTPINDSGAITVAADATAHTKGAWVTLVASASADTTITHLTVSGVGASTVNTATLIDVAIGGAGSEVAVVSNIAIGGAIRVPIVLPIDLPAGARLSARIQSVVTGGKTATVRALTFAAGPPTVGALTTLGADTANSRGVVLTTADTYVQAVASTAAAYRGLVLVPSIHDGNVAGITATTTVAVGGAGAEVDIGSIEWTTTTTELLSAEGIPVGLFAVDIAAGSRIAVKQTGIAANQTRYGVSVLAIPV